MLAYAKEIYPAVREDIEAYEGSYSTHYKRIQRGIESLFGHETGEYTMKPELARIIVREFLADTLNKNELEPTEKYAEAKKKREQEKRSEIEAKSQKQDEELNKKVITIATVNALQEDPTYDTNIPLKEKVEKIKEKYSYWNDNHEEKDNFSYYIPDIPENELTEEMVDKIVDRTMLRALFNLFFTFKEREFRTDLYERTKLIKEIGDGIGEKYETGYSELTRRLKIPMDYYISVRKK